MSGFVALMILGTGGFQAAGKGNRTHLQRIKVKLVEFFQTAAGGKRKSSTTTVASRAVSIGRVRFPKSPGTPLPHLPVAVFAARLP
ncbi:hypothetical protein [Roseobacter weihaiensis]|uniref:hypothetical protein n=1 Tax=Roseobacter weihaiensis TaxID=2763262 RepID=UPI001D0AF6BB|nr:hypothetical protein [Roseobacter sp. H9]